MEKAVYGGASLARVPADGPPDLAGKAVFVPLTLPGELVEATIASDRRSYIKARLDSILEPSPARITPGCEYYGRCGGCHYQHADYATQLAMKRSILIETLERAHVSLPGDVRVLSADPWAYRNRIRLHVTKTALSYREAASHRDLSVTHCPVAAPLLQAAIAAFNQLLQKQPSLSQSVSEVEFFTAADESALLVSLSTRLRKVPEQLPRSVADALLPALPVLQGVRTFFLDPGGRPQSSASWGKPSLEYAVGPLRYQVSAGAFFQVNRYLIPMLLEEVVAQRNGNVAWDLYAGVGLFAQALAQRFEQVIAVESSPASTTDLARNLHGSGHKRITKDTLRFLQSPPAPAPDLVVVDPPRAGLGAEVCQRLSAVRPRQIVYVSCDPSTLARDLRTLQPSGYRPLAVTLIDLFPQTFHLETVVTLERT
ncbi:MAG TPA: 23S rRNA (uracil(1939)-C(5))-methyltransferase RlmD [Acidobacteriaceae bacterium]|nr:23S rRNA (uracil(1939)-C(5))-methyltransferase RlmD [Acidobacteriaceae bacterium]